MSGHSNPPTSPSPSTGPDEELPFTIDTDHVGDYIRFFDDREPIRGDKSIIRYLYYYAAQAKAESRQGASATSGVAKQPKDSMSIPLAWFEGLLKCADAVHLGNLDVGDVAELKGYASSVRHLAQGSDLAGKGPLANSDVANPPKGAQHNIEGEHEDN